MKLSKLYKLINLYYHAWCIYMLIVPNCQCPRQQCLYPTKYIICDFPGILKISILPYYFPDLQRIQQILE